jgi:VanZ family protein
LTATPRRWGWVLTVAAAALIAAATLIPQSVPSCRSTAPRDCWVCDELAGVDVLLNILLFVPLGFGLRLAGVRAWRVVAIAAGASACIELAQLGLIAGRDSSVRDWAANTAGAAVGCALAASWRRLLLPTDDEARRLRVAAAAGFLVATTAACALLAPGFLPTTWYGQWAREGVFPATFTGRVSSVRLDDLPLPDRDFDDSDRVRSELGRSRWTLAIDAAVGTPTPAMSSIFSIFDGQEREMLVVGQDGTDLVARFRTAASNAGFRSPTIVLPAALDCPAGEPLSITLAYDRGAVSLSAGPRAARSERLTPGPAWGWTLAAPFEARVGGARAAWGMAWLSAWLFPWGYWSFRSGRPVLEVLALGALLAVGLGLVPMAFRLSPSGPLEWVGAACGVLAGGWAGSWARSGRARMAAPVAVLVAATLTIAAATPASAASYPLRKSANGRYLVDRAGAPFMVVGDAPQSLIVNLSEPEADAYFADRQAHGFNTVWVNLLCTTYTGGRADASTFDGVLPFTSMLPSSDTYDLTTPNEAYFLHVDRVLRLAASHGIMVLLDPIETGGFLGTIIDNGAERSLAFGRFVGSRYAGFDNIVWMNGNDFQDWRTAPLDALVFGVALGIREKDARHLQTIELDYLVSSSLDDPLWAPVLGINSTYTYYPTYARLLQDYARSDFLPNVLVEANYEFESPQGPATNAKILRKQEYWAMTSGAAGQMYGNFYTVRFPPGWQDNLDTPGATEMKYLVALFGTRAWYDLVPDATHDVLTDGFGTYADTGYVDDNDYATAARTPNGTLVIAYTPVVRPLTIDMSKLAAAATARWYDPASGVWVAIDGSPFANLGSLTFTPPGPNADGDGGWALVIETRTMRKPHLATEKRALPAL